MKTIPLRQLVREPLTVKRMTSSGQSVQVTDNGKPLWIIQPATASDEDEERRLQAVDEILDDVLGKPSSGESLSKIIIDSRR